MGAAALWRGIRTKRWTFAYSAGVKGGDWVPFDLENDPYQMKNLVDDPEHAAVKAELKTRLEQWRRDLGDTIDLQAFVKSRP